MIWLEWHIVNPFVNFYGRTNKSSATNTVGRHLCVNVEPLLMHALHFIIPPPFASSGLIGFTFAGASSLENVVPPSWWRSLLFRLSDQFLAEFGFGNFLPAESSLFSFGSYNHKFGDAPFTFSVESYVGVNHHRRKKRRPNRQYRKKSGVKKSCWYREFLRRGMTRDLTHELSASDRFGKFRSYFRATIEGRRTHRYFHQPWKVQGHCCDDLSSAGGLSFLSWLLTTSQKCRARHLRVCRSQK